jgi:hypothetical protein
MSASWRWLYHDYARMPIAEACVSFVADLKKVAGWHPGSTRDDYNDQDLIRK